mgnify:CR=1 FL=1
MFKLYRASYRGLSLYFRVSHFLISDWNRGSLHWVDHIWHSKRVGCGVKRCLRGVLYDHTVCVYTVYFQNMQLHVGGLGELPVTELTRVRPLPCVTEHVAVELRRGYKPFATHIALMFVVRGIVLNLRRGHSEIITSYYIKVPSSRLRIKRRQRKRGTRRQPRPASRSGGPEGSP